MNAQQDVAKALSSQQVKDHMLTFTGFILPAVGDKRKSRRIAQ